MISKEVEFLRELLKDEEDMCETIPFPIPEIEEAAYKDHQRRIIKLKQCIRKLCQSTWMRVGSISIRENEHYIACDDVGNRCTIKGSVLIELNKVNDEREAAGIRGLNYTHVMPLLDAPE